MPEVEKIPGECFADAYSDAISAGESEEESRELARLSGTYSALMLGAQANFDRLVLTRSREPVGDVTAAGDKAALDGDMIISFNEELKGL